MENLYRIDFENKNPPVLATQICEVTVFLVLQALYLFTYDLNPGALFLLYFFPRHWEGISSSPTIL